jgi:hypothetical protein
MSLHYSILQAVSDFLTAVGIGESLYCARDVLKVTRSVSDGGVGGPRLRFGLLDWVRRHLRSCRVEFILFAATNETFAIQTPAAKRLIPTRVRYNCLNSDQNS